MKLRLYSVVAALTVLGGLLSMPATAQAATPKASIATSTLAVSTGGYGSVYVKCASAKPCKGKVTVANSGYTKSFTVSGRSGKWVGVRVLPSQAGYPVAAAGQTMWDARGTVRVNLTQTSTVKGSSSKALTTWFRYPNQPITGTITPGAATPAHLRSTSVKVQLYAVRRDGSGSRVRSTTAAIGPTGLGTYNLGTVPAGMNNGPSPVVYKIKIVGIDPVSHREVSWWWRGANNYAAGGGRHWRDGSTFQVSATAPFVANFTYGSVVGSVRSGATPVPGAEMTVAAPPAEIPASATGQKELDVAWCANTYASATTDGAGNYSFNFLPMASGSDRRYLVATDARRVPGYGNTFRVWSNAAGDFGTCLSTESYVLGHNAQLLDLAGASGNLVRDIQVGASNNRVNLSARYAVAVSSTNVNDSYVRVREYLPGRTVTEMPVVYENRLSGTGKSLSGVVAGLPSGQYRLEVGRRTGCSQWMKSRYKDNNGYFKGLDRAFERKWAKNYRMYRGHCRAIGAGAVLALNISANTGQVINATATVHKGATVKGKITAAKIKPRTELMVRLVPTSTNLVYRTALTDGAGRFSVSGLAPGCYKVVVNADSWRGISRTASGRNSICVRGSGTYSIGTKRFNQKGPATKDTGL